MNTHKDDNKPNILDNRLDQAPKTGERYQNVLTNNYGPLYAEICNVFDEGYVQGEIQQLFYNKGKFSTKVMHLDTYGDDLLRQLKAICDITTNTPNISIVTFGLHSKKSLLKLFKETSIDLRSNSLYTLEFYIMKVLLNPNIQFFDMVEAETGEFGRILDSNEDYKKEIQITDEIRSMISELVQRPDHGVHNSRVESECFIMGQRLGIDINTGARLE